MFAVASVARMLEPGGIPNPISFPHFDFLNNAIQNGRYWGKSTQHIRSCSASNFLSDISTRGTTIIRLGETGRSARGVAGRPG